MGYKTVQKVMSRSRAKGTARLVLIVLATHANDQTGLCIPSRKLLCQEAAMEERNLVYALKQLEAEGEILTTRGNGRGHLTEYQIIIAKQERVQDLVAGDSQEAAEDAAEKDALSGDKGCKISLNKGARFGETKIERVQDLEQRVQDLGEKGANLGNTYNEIEPSCNHQGTKEESFVESSDSTAIAKPKPAKKKSTDTGKFASEISEVFSYWQSTLNHPSSKLDKKRKRLIRERLEEEYSVDDLKRAIDGCKVSDFHQGMNDQGKVYDDIALICRDASKVEQFWGFLNARRNGAGRVSNGKAFVSKSEQIHRNNLALIEQVNGEKDYVDAEALYD